MALVRKGNVELNIEDIYIDKYLNRGFNLIDIKGKIITEGVPDNANLKQAYDALETKYNEVVKENKKLKKQLKLNVE